MTKENIVDEICRLEDERGRALVNADWDALSALVSDDVVHIHGNGLIEDKATYLESIRTKLEFIKVERTSYMVRVYGDVAVATGILEQTVRVKGPGTVVTARLATTQVWVKAGNRWTQNSFQGTRLDA